jgi:3-deoxy-D-manno-octulosonate 8-phosphate phosphatase (KDO 8-P phosphatase)
MINPEVARRIKVFGLDVDGVLTDNAVYIGNVQGERVELKRFDIQDGLGLAVLRNSEIKVVWLSGRHSEATTMRAAELQIEEVMQIKGAAKLPAMTELMQRLNVTWDEIAFVGDDLADIPVLRRCGLPMAVSNAVPEVLACAAYITRSPGGQGAVRDAIEALLKARGSWDEAVRGYLRDRGDDAA